MDAVKRNAKASPWENVSFFSVIFFTYTFEVFKKGCKKVLDVTDIHSPLSSDRSATVGNRLESQWKKHLEAIKATNKRPSLFKVVGETFWPEYLLLGFILFLTEFVLRLIQPYALGELLDYFKPNTKRTKNEALYWAGVLALVTILTAILNCQYYMRAYHYALRVRASCCSLIYRKSLKLSRAALANTASGKVVNLLSNDVGRFDSASMLINYAWLSPLITVIVAYLLYSKAGYAGLIGMVPLCLIVPFQGYAGKLTANYRRVIAMKIDERIRMMDEIIGGIQVIKMYAWERPFGKLVTRIRRMEMKISKYTCYVRSVYMTFTLFSTRLALFCVLLTIVLTDQEITAANVYIFSMYFALLSRVTAAMFVRLCAEIPELFVSFNRIEQFLLSEEHVSFNREVTYNKINNDDVVVSMRAVSAKWDVNDSQNVLRKLEINIKNRSLIGIIGQVGSGKSSLLQTILGEMYIESGKLEINGRLSYASQEPWVFAATIRQNIVFGEEYERKRYLKVIRACALEKDFHQFANGDLTVIGDRGASLSGGQKARVNLARAIYRDADIYLLDDPLSAVDTRVAKHLYKECINGFLANKARVLVTHQVHHLRNCERIIIMKNGCIEQEGSYRELVYNCEYNKLLHQESKAKEDKNTKYMSNFKLQPPLSYARRSSTSSAFSDSSVTENSIFEDSNEMEITIQEMTEKSSKGKVSGSLFLKYLLSGGNYGIVLTVILLYVITEVLISEVDYFVGYWTDVEAIRNSDHKINATRSFLIDPEHLPTTNTCLYIYAGLLTALPIFALSRSVLFYILTLRNSQKLHDSMFSGVINATMRFFDTNPSGRILNRFAKDLGTMDELLPKTLLDALQSCLLMSGYIILVGVVNPMLMIPVFVIAIIFMVFRSIFLKSSVNLMRLEGMTRSPVFTHLNATLQGIATIRAYGAQTILKKEFDKHQDLHSGAWFMFFVVGEAFGLYLDLLCSLFSIFVTFSFLTFAEGISGGQVGLAITQASALTQLVQWAMRQSAEVFNYLTSAERVIEYTQLPPEKQPVLAIIPPQDWPSEGRIVFRDMGLKYADNMPFVIKNLNITILPKEKIGIVGRTGAGKSSLIAALFRLAIVEGAIEIDGIDTKNLLLEELRTKIAIIPQDPVLFSGTLRYNLDPFEEYPDHTLYSALQRVELRDNCGTITRLENPVMDRGANYSVGQRQLICLARAIVRNNKILMLDEATANVDPQTDALIQKTIRQQFADCTVLTVAHRLNTIMDSDKVLVMDFGTLVEFDHPYNLLDTPKSIFYKMAAETGKTMMEEFKKVAQQSLTKNKSE